MPFDQGHALVIGVGTHKFSPELDIPQTANDARAIYEVLINERVCGYPRHQVDLLLNEYATKDRILDSLDRLSNRARPEDTVLIFFSGISDYGNDGNYHMVCHDTNIMAGNVQAGTGVSQSDLLNELSRIQSARVLLLYNSCFTGKLANSSPYSKVLSSRSLPDSVQDALLATGSGRIILTACGSDQFSFIGKEKLTPFTQAVVDALWGKGILPRGGLISVYDLYASVYDKVSEVVKDLYGYEQEPTLTVLKGIGPFAISLYRGAQDTMKSLDEGFYPRGQPHSQDSPIRITEGLEELPNIKLEDLQSIDDYYRITLNSLVSNLNDIQPGGAGKDYEECVFKLLKIFFRDQLRRPRREPRTIDGTERRDITFFNLSDHLFWRSIFQRYDANFIMFECKNTISITNNHINQVATYLGKRLGRFGVIVTRNEPEREQKRKALSVFNEDKKVILFLNDNDIVEMTELSKNEEDPSKIIEDKLEEFLLSAQ